VPATVPRVYDGADGYLIGRTLVSYAHVHFASNSALARGFVDACADAAR
jgi:cobyrinic acid a,c-diamide synthase